MSKWELFVEKLKTPKGKKILIITIIVIILVGVLSWTIYNRYFKKSVEDTSSSLNINVKEGEKVAKTASMLDGVEYPKDDANRHPIAIMIENHPEARPQVGLNKASVVYETEAEGGITRFMAIFGPEDADMVGPVRSARTYFVDWAYEYDAFYAHCGGSADGLALIDQIGIKDLNQFNVGTAAYWREAENKATEHTLYTDTNKLRDVAKSNGWNVSTSDYEAYKFKKDAEESQRPTSQIITVPFSGSLYSVVWKYNKADNNYLREMADIAHNDRITDEQLTAKNIVVQEVPRTLITNSGGKQVWQLDTIGEGNALVFLDGKKIEGTWKKSSQGNRTKFYDPSGNEIEFNPGTTWIEVVPPGSVITEESEDTLDETATSE